MSLYGEDGFEKQCWERHFGSKTNAVAKCGHEIYKASHGQEHSRFGWDVDHIYPESKNGSDLQDNLQPLCCDCNKEKADKLSGVFSSGIRFNVSEIDRSSAGKIIGKMTTSR